MKQVATTITNDGAGRGSTRTYDALNRLTKTTNALDGMVQFSYDAYGNRLPPVALRPISHTHARGLEPIGDRA